MNKPNVDIWQFQMGLSARLMQWAGFSVGTGTALALSGDRFKQGVGGQFVGWGLIDGLLAFFGAQNATKQSEEPEAHAPERQAEERRNLRTILSVNTGLDVFYILGGLWLARTKGRDDEFWRGSGWGIVIQGAFLFVFDLIHALQLKRDA
jgi:hypothetical protein